MVDARLGQDLLSFRRPILVLGDPAQLPPIKARAISRTPHPMCFSHRFIARQSATPSSTSPDACAPAAAAYAKVSTAQAGSYRSAPSTSRPCSARTNPSRAERHTRNSVNTRVRELLGHRGPLPVRGDKLVCLRNDHQRGLLNGEIWFVEAVLAPEVSDVVRLAHPPRGRHRHPDGRCPLLPLRG